VASHPAQQLRCQLHVLSVGSGESGKSTIVKQMKIIHQDGFSEQELLQFRPVIYKNVLDSAKAVVLYMIKVGLECVEYSNRVSFFLVAGGLAGPPKALGTLPMARAGQAAKLWKLDTSGVPLTGHLIRLSRTVY